MTKAEKKIWNVVKNTTIGAVGGTIFGISVMPLTALACITAPVSYPILGAVTGNGYDPFSHKGTSMLAGVAIGTCMIPAAPVGLLLIPTLPLQGAVTGAIVGGVVGVVKNQKEDK